MQTLTFDDPLEFQMTSLRGGDASLDTITKGFIDSFTNSDELEEFTEILCIDDNP